MNSSMEKTSLFFQSDIAARDFKSTPSIQWAHTFLYSTFIPKQSSTSEYFDHKKIPSESTLNSDGRRPHNSI